GRPGSRLPPGHTARPADNEKKRIAMRVFLFATPSLPAALLVAGICAAAPARAEPTIDITGYGHFETERTGKRVKRPKTASGEVTPVRRRRLVKKTTTIFGQLDRSFGIELDLKGFPPGPVRLTIRTLHPPLTNPKTGRTLSASEYEWDVTGRNSVYFGFTFDYRWELAEGSWVQQIWYKGRLLAQKKFKVVVPLN
ncbi:MAG: DUF3859 domain-containing protein, partial [Bauldia litoralis]